MRVTDVSDLPPEFAYLGEQAVPATVYVYTGVDGTVINQLRPDTPIDGAKYLFPVGSSGVNWLPVSLTFCQPTVLIVEGTKQALAARAYAGADIDVLGIAGCRGWYRDGSPNPDLAVTAGRRVIICLDADAATNLDVYSAGVDLAAALAIEGATSVSFIQLPGSKKVGLDDLLESRPQDDRARYLASLIAAAKAKPAATKPRPAPAKKQPGRIGPDISNLRDRRAVVINGDRWGVIGELTEALRSRWAGTRLFNRGGVFAQLRGSGVAALDTDSFLDLIQETVMTVSADRQDGAEETVYTYAWPDANTLQALNSRADTFPELAQVTSVPYLRADGKLIQTPGYDAQSCTYLLPDETLAALSVPTVPTPADVAAAVAVLRDEWLGDFPLATPADQANALATVLTPLVRNLVYLSPMCVVDGLQMGVGKNLFADCLSILVTGKHADPLPYTRNEDETRKAILSVFRQGKPFMVWDEAHTVEGPALARALTAVTYTDRILGSSRMAEFPNRITWLALGNAVAVNGDMARRVYRVALRPEYANPQNRSAASFNHPDIRRWTLENRPQILNSALTLLTNWVAKGRPFELSGPTFGSFEQWQATVGGILQAAGVEGFLDGLDAWREETDFDGSYWVSHLLWLQEKVGSEEFTASQVADLLKRDPLGESPPKVTNPSDPDFNRQLGKAYSSIADRVIDGISIHKGSLTGRKVVKWRLVEGLEGKEGMGRDEKTCSTREKKHVFSESQKNAPPRVQSQTPSLPIPSFPSVRTFKLPKVIADKLSTATVVERPCDKCGVEEELVPPSMIWFACRTCHPSTFGEAR